MAKLRETEQNLRSFREAAFEQLEEENQIAAAKTVSALSPALEELQKVVNQSEDIVSLAHKMSDFIKNELRPFSAQLSNDAMNLSTEVSPNDGATLEEPEPLISLRKSLRVGIILLPIAVLHYLIAAFAIPSATGVDMLAASLIFASVVAVIKLATFRIPDLSQRNAFIATTVIALVAPIPSFFLISQIPNLHGVPELLPVFYILPGWSVIASGQAYILDQKLSRIEYQLNYVVEELARENKLYEQKAWLARHGWYLLLHGVVQPAITTAAIRATNAPAITENVKSQIIADLQRALDSLIQGNTDNQNLEFNISEIRSVWEGICEVEFEVSQQVFDKAHSDPIINQVINEILKELVSNAVRHGNASKVQIRLTLESPLELQIVAYNDGTKPVKDRVESVGSRMLEAFCLDRSLQWNSTTKMTEFKALIPFKS
jgi:two-component sensor histidine kinase